jgi:catechol 2,3-dioxygenase-like lactoylglutathione lyase family enzyme
MGDSDAPRPPSPLGHVVRASEVSANLGFIHLVVDDMARSLTFYEHFGFKFPREAVTEPHVEAEMKSGLVISWNRAGSVRTYAPDYRPGPHGRVALAFQQETPAAVDELFYELQELSYRVDRVPWDAPWGHRYAVVYDPDGNVIEIFAPHL